MSIDKDYEDIAEILNLTSVAAASSANDKGSATRDLFATPSRRPGGGGLFSDVASPATDILRLLETRGGASNVGGSPIVEQAPQVQDEEDFVTIHYGAKCSFRGKQGHFLAVASVNQPSPATSSSTPVRERMTAAPSARLPVYQLTSHGLGIGDLQESFAFATPTKALEGTPIRYGDTICLRALGAQDRYVCVREGQLGLWRTMIGQSEKWTIAKGGSYGLEDDEAFGTFVRFGDFVVLKANTGARLSLHESYAGTEIQLADQTNASLAELWQVTAHSSPPYPHWNLSRPYLNGSFILSEGRHSTARPTNTVFSGRGSSSRDTLVTPSLADVPVAEQEKILAHELLGSFLGAEGMYIRVQMEDATAQHVPNPSHAKFVLVAPRADPAVTQQIESLLSMSTGVLRIKHFVQSRSRYEYGMVSHALAAAIRLLLREFYLLVTQLEDRLVRGDLSLQKLQFFVQQSRTTIQQLEKLTVLIGEKTGGSLLNTLHMRMLSQGDEKGSRLHTFLMRKASTPYVHMLRRWLCKGGLDDRYEEFMIHENQDVSKETLEQDFNAQYWDSRYVIREEHVVGFLRDYTRDILTTGKYLTVVRECGVEAHFDEDIGDITDMNSARLREVIQRAHEFASKALLDLLINKHDLFGRLRSLKHFFLLDQGDFFVQFMDTAEEELRRDVSDITLSRMESLLQLSLQTSTLANDEYTHDLICMFAPYNLIQHLHMIHSWADARSDSSFDRSGSRSHASQQGLKGVEAFTLDYKVSWPLSIILSRRAITKYQLIFRLLFFSKHVERRLFTSWMDHQATKEFDVRLQLGPSFCLRHRMLHFLQNFVYYVGLEVVGPNWHILQERIHAAADVDELHAAHENFLDTCLKECLLASQDLLRVLTKLMTTCLLFAEQMRRFAASLHVDESSVRTAAENVRAGSERLVNVRRDRVRIQSHYLRKEVTLESYVKMIHNFEETFDGLLQDFMEKLWADAQHSHPQLANLCVRIDYNGYLAAKIAQNNHSTSMRSASVR